MSEKDNEVQDNEAMMQWHHKKHKLFFGFVVLVILAIVFMFGFGAGRMSTRFNNYRTGEHGMFYSNNGNNIMGGFSYSTSLPVGQNTTNQIEITGVVSLINGNKVTVVGGGVSNIITTNSSTQYINGSSLAVNDSVDIIGQYSNNVLTASSITINP